MAPFKQSARGHEASSTPLADYFWIAGLDGQDLLEAYIKLGEEENRKNGSGNDLGNTIVEDEVAEAETSSILESPVASAAQSKRSSYQRLSRLSGDAQASIRSLDKVTSGTSSARSSATIRAVPPTSPHTSAFMNDFDFDRALKKFATDRDSFFLDVNFSAGALTQPSRPKPRPKTQRMASHEEQAPGLSRGFGSVRKHMSFREMKSAKRQSSMARQASVRTSRRTSNYNSVIPDPEPLQAPPTMHPLKRKFEPALLDRYPQKGMPDESRRRGNFPDYVPMFAFPNDINVVSSDSRPRSTWHGFSMTAADNSRLHAICIIVWVPINPQVATELEKRCEEWRRANMTDAERELALSLGERLAAERAKLSRLLSRLPYIDSGSRAREQLEDEISAVEEKIVMMTEMLRPLRHGAASRIEGLTDSDTGLWIPRAYGILGRDSSMTGFWKEWLRAITVPMADGAVLRVPLSSPRVGMWHPLERYIVSLCTDAPSPISSKTQVEVAVRELRMFARKEAINELPGSRDTDLYALFRALTIPNILVLFEYVLAESRIILLSSHTAMLHLVSKAIVELTWPLKWAGIFIPVLPVRLIQALEAPCPYICGIERRYEKVELPEDDFVLVDLDNDEIESTTRPTPLPRQQRRKLMSLLQLAAPHHNKFGVPPGPPAYAIEAMPCDSFASENPSVFSAHAPSTSLARLVGLTSTSFGTTAAADGPRKPLVMNAFLHVKTGSRGSGTGDRPRTASTSTQSNSDSPTSSPVTASFPQLPATPVSRSDSGFALQASLRDKRAAHFDTGSKASGDTQRQARRQPSLPFLGHSSNPSIATLNPEAHNQSSYAPSTYAQSTLAASTIMPQLMVQPVRNTETTSWIEGHCLRWHGSASPSTCAVCDEKIDDGLYRCSGCGATVHARCGQELYVVCPAAFYPEQIRAAFVRCFASLFYTYRKFMLAPTSEQKKNGMFYRFDLNSFLRSVPSNHADYIAVLQQTQAFNGFISERECTPPAPTSSSSTSVHTSIILFDSIILSKRNRGRLLPTARQLPGLSLTSSMKNTFSSSSRLAASAFSHSSSSSRHNSSSNTPPDFLSDTSHHVWRTTSATSHTATSHPHVTRTDFGDPSRDYREIVIRVPAKLEEIFMREPPRVIQGAPTPKVPHPERPSSNPGQAKGHIGTEAGAGTGSSTGTVANGTKNTPPPPTPMSPPQQQQQQPPPPPPKQAATPLREKINGLALNAPDPMLISASPRADVVGLPSPTLTAAAAASSASPARRSRAGLGKR